MGHLIYLYVLLAILFWVLRLGLVIIFAVLWMTTGLLVFITAVLLSTAVVLHRSIVWLSRRI